MLALNYLMTAVFLFCVLVQYNDPDPLPWMAIYGAAATACVCSLVNRLYWPIPVATGIVAIMWAGYLASSVVGVVSIPEMFASFEMKNPAVEEAREMGGLLIVAAWMAVLTYATVARRRNSTTHVAKKGAS